MNFKPHHVAFTVKNIEESIKWYKDILDLPLLFRYEKDGMKLALLKLADSQIELFEFGKTTEALPIDRKNLMTDLHVIGTKHLCLETDNLDATIEQLKNKGVKFATETDTTAFGGRYIF